MAGHLPIGVGQDPLPANLQRGLVLASGSTSGVRSVCHQAWVQAITPPSVSTTTVRSSVVCPGVSISHTCGLTR